MIERHVVLLKSASAQIIAREASTCSRFSTKCQRFWPIMSCMGFYARVRPATATTIARTGGLGVARGAALYIGAVLGPGVLLLPALAAQAAGPASVLAWSALLGVSLALAATFAALGVRLPVAGGAAAYVRAAYGHAACGRHRLVLLRRRGDGRADRGADRRLLRRPPARRRAAVACADRRGDDGAGPRGQRRRPARDRDDAAGPCGGAGGAAARGGHQRAAVRAREQLDAVRAARLAGDRHAPRTC